MIFLIFNLETKSDTCWIQCHRRSPNSSVFFHSKFLISFSLVKTMFHFSNVSVTFSNCSLCHTTKEIKLPVEERFKRDVAIYLTFFFKTSAMRLRFLAWLWKSAAFAKTCLNCIRIVPILSQDSFILM